jgi:hypothetical protein
MVKVPDAYGNARPIRSFLCEIECDLEFALSSGNPRAPEAVGDLLETFIRKAQRLDYVLRKEQWAEAGK